MKSRESKLILIIVILVILLIGMSINLILNPKGILTRTKQIVKEMTETEYDSSITELNKSHTDYARQVQENKRKLAQAISNENVDTSENATVDEMVTNIGKILEARTSDATATAEDIAEGKTAWINGEKIKGISKEYDLQLYDENTNTSTATFDENITLGILTVFVAFPGNSGFPDVNINITTGSIEEIYNKSIESDTVGTLVVRSKIKQFYIKNVEKGSILNINVSYSWLHNYSIIKLK